MGAEQAWRPGQHPTAEELLLAHEDQLPRTQAEPIVAHLHQCWQCRAHVEQYQRGIDSYLKFRDMHFDPAMKPQPGGWLRLSARLAGSVQEPQPSRFRWPVPQPLWIAFPVLAAAAICAALFWPMPLTATVVLDRAMRAEAAPDPRPSLQRLTIRRGGRVMAEDEFTIRKAYLDPAHPLSARSFCTWHDSLHARRDSVFTGTDEIRVQTTTTEGEIALARIDLARVDYQPQAKHVELRDGVTIDVEAVEPFSAARTAKVDEAPAAAGSSVKAGLRPGEREALEMEVRWALHLIDADLGEPLECFPSGVAMRKRCFGGLIALSLLLWPGCSKPTAVQVSSTAPVSTPALVQVSSTAPVSTPPAVQVSTPTAVNVSPPAAVHVSPTAARVSAPPSVHVSPTAARVSPPAAVHVNTLPKAQAVHSHSSATVFRQKRWLGAGPLPAGRYAAARQAMSQMPHASLALGSWEPLGPGNVAGRTKALVIDPTTPGTMYAASAAGGIWKTINAGVNWTPLTDSLPVLAMSSLAIDPTNPQTLYAGSGEQLPGAGIFKTTDGGQTWSQLAGTAGLAYVFSIAVSPSRPSNLYAATDSGLWSSADGGSTWANVLPSRGGCYSTVVRGDQPSDIVFAACSQTDGYPLVQLQVELWSYPPGGNYSIYRGEMSRGAESAKVAAASHSPAPSRPAASWTWQRVLTVAKMGPTALAIAPTAPNTVYALATLADTSSPFNMALLGLYASDGGGLPGTWELRADTSDPNSITANMLSYPAQPPDCSYSISGLHSGQGGWNLGLVVDPTDSQTLFAAGVRLSRSQDGGRTFAGLTTTANALGHTDFHAYAFDANYNGSSDQTLFSTNDGGVYRSDIARTAAETLSCSQPFYSLTGGAVNSNLQVTQFYHGVVTPGGGLYLGGSQDTAMLLGSAAAPTNWTPVYGGDGGMSAFDPLDPNVMYFEYEGLEFARTIDGVDTYIHSTTGIAEPATDFPFVTYFALDPNHAQTLYIGGHQLWQSVDGAQSWHAASPNTGAAISAIAVNPNNSNQVIYGDQAGLIYNGGLNPTGNNWTSTQPRSGYVSGFTFDATQPGRVYATYATLRAQPSDNQVYISTDNGNTWSAPAGSNLPDIPVHVLLIDPDKASTLYIGTDLGVLVSFDSGLTWAVDSSLPAVVTSSLQMDRNGATKYLYAFTYGRGAWRVNLTPGAAECTYSVSPQTFTMTGSGGQLYSIAVYTAAGCAWAATAAPSLPYIRMQSPAGGVGPGTLYFTVGTNFSGGTRVLPIEIQDQTVVVTQSTLSTSSLAFDELASAPAIPSLPYYRAVAFGSLTANASDPVHSCTGSADLSTGWFVYTATASQTIDVNLQTGGYGGVLTAYPYAGSGRGKEMACATNSSNSAANLSLQFAVTAGSRYAIEVAGVEVGLGLTARVSLLVQVLPAVAITAGSTSLSAGQTTQFAASVTGTPNTSVRWTAQYGAIDAHGNYKAPAHGQASADTVTAISFADSNASASVTVTLQ